MRQPRRLHNPARWTLARRLACFAAVASVGALSGVGCSALLGEQGAAIAGAAACPEWASGNAIGATFTDNAELNADVAVFVQAAADLRGLVNEIEGEVVAACRGIGANIGVSAEAMKPKDGVGGAMEGACNPVSARIDEILKASANVKLDVGFTPPSCKVSADVSAQCAGQCKVEVTPAEIVAKCSPAELSGTCEGTCQGQCDGVCNGTCNGTCSAKDAQGNCVGSCDGTCNGTCEATCHAKCDGEWKAPRCETSVTGPSAKADCMAACQARADIKASCEPPAVTASVDAAAAAELKTLAASLRAHLPALINAQVRLGKQLAGDVKVLVKAGQHLKGELGDAGGKAVACVGAAVSGLADVSVKVNVSVKVSASVSGKVGAGGSAG